MTRFQRVKRACASTFALQCKTTSHRIAHGTERVVTTFKDLVPGAPAGRFDGIERPYSAADSVAAARLAPDPPYARRACGRAALAAARRGGLRQLPRRGLRQSGHADGARRAEGDLPLRLAGRRRRQYRRRHVSRPVALSGEFRPRAGAPHQPHPAARRPDRDDGRQAARSRPGSRRSSPMRRPASAARSTPSRS